MEARAQATQYRLEGELAGYKTNLIKESIRMGHHELADFFYERGDLQVGLPFLGVLGAVVPLCTMQSKGIFSWQSGGFSDCWLRLPSVAMAFAELHK